MSGHKSGRAETLSPNSRMPPIATSRYVHLAWRTVLLRQRPIGNQKTYDRTVPGAFLVPAHAITASNAIATNEELELIRGKGERPEPARRAPNGDDADAV
jgi:hypothetical protein